jgi:hypothetical protein
MSAGRYSFKMRDTARLVRAVEAAGKKIRGVSLTGSTVTVLIDDGEGSVPAQPSDLDTWMEKHADKTARD